MDKVNEILARETWDESDINTLIANLSLLPESAKVRLGLAPEPVKVEEPVIVEKKHISKK